MYTTSSSYTPGTGFTGYFVFWLHRTLQVKDLMLLVSGICGFPEPPFIPQLYGDGAVGAPLMSYDNHYAKEGPQPPSEHIGQL